MQYQSGRDLGIGHLFNVFRGWWEAKDKRNVADKLQELRRHSDVFAKLFVPESESQVNIFATRLKTLDTSTVYPVLLMLLAGGCKRIVNGDLDDT